MWRLKTDPRNSYSSVYYPGFALVGPLQHSQMSLWYKKTIPIFFTSLILMSVSNDLSMQTSLKSAYVLREELRYHRNGLYVHNHDRSAVNHSTYLAQFLTNLLPMKTAGNLRANNCDPKFDS